MCRHFPLALHHPKEDQHLFHRLRERTDEFNAELDELERQHHRDDQLVAELAQRVETLARRPGRAGGSGRDARAGGGSAAPTPASCGTTWAARKA